MSLFSYALLGLARVSSTYPQAHVHALRLVFSYFMLKNRQIYFTLFLSGIK